MSIQLINQDLKNTIKGVLIRSFVSYYLSHISDFLNPSGQIIHFFIIFSILIPDSLKEVFSLIILLLLRAKLGN